MRRVLTVQSVAFGLALVTGIALAGIGIWLILDPDRRDIGSLAGISGGLLGAFAMLLQTGHRLWFDLRGDQRAQHSDSMATLRERNEVNAKISTLYERGAYAAGSARSIELEQLQEHRAYLTSVLEQRQLIERAPRVIASPAGNRDAALTGDEAERLRKLIERSAASTEILDADGWFLRGNALFATGEYAQALGAYDRSLELSPGDSTVLYNRGAALLSLGRGQEALAIFDGLLDQCPTDAEALHNRGATLAGLGRFEEAIEAYDATLAQRPQEPDTLFNRGVALGELGRFEAALDAFEDALRVRPDDPDTWAGIGASLVSLGRYEEALNASDRSLRLRPGDPIALQNRARALALAGLGRDEYDTR